MDCSRHPGVPAKTNCQDCASPVCGDCTVTWQKRVICPSCARDAMAAETAVPIRSMPSAALGNQPLDFRARKNKFIAFILGMVPGLGHWYLGLEVRGLCFMLAFFGTIALTVITGQGLLGLVMGPIWLYALADTMWAFDELAMGFDDADRLPAVFRLGGLGDTSRRRLVGTVLVVVGIASVLNNLPDSVLPDVARTWIRSNMLGAGLIILGIWFIVRRGLGSGNSGVGEPDEGGPSL